MASQINIYNMALGHIGSSEVVADLAERSISRVKCSLYYEICRDMVMSDFNWRFATKVVTLADIGSPIAPWLYRYRYPNDCLKAIRILFDQAVPAGQVFPLLTISGFPPEALQPPFEVVWEESGKAIITNWQYAQLEYITQITEAERFPAQFVDMLAYRLAAAIAMPLKNSSELSATCMAMYENQKQLAWSQSLNEAQFDQGENSIYVNVMHG